MHLSIFIIYLALAAIFLIISAFKGSRFFGIFSGLVLLILFFNLLTDPINIQTGETIGTTSLEYSIGNTTFTNTTETTTITYEANDSWTWTLLEIAIFCIGMYLLLRNVISIEAQRDTPVFYR